ncbi:MAG: short-subunit dehydrogenase [Crocinitomicaceae bacterium]
MRLKKFNFKLKDKIEVEKTKNQKYRFIEHILFPPKSVNLEKLRSSLSNKTVLITGASYGIGEELAYLLAMDSIHLILVGRTEEKLNLVKKTVESNGATAEVQALDLRNEEQLDSFIEALISREKGIDVFVSNAGKSIRRSIYDSLDREHDFERTMAINYHVPVKLCLALIPILEKNNGQIINISAINVLIEPMPEWAAYQASKSAFDQWFRSVVPEVNARGIATSTIYLPLVKTRMITPTKAYDKMPAMKAPHVARLIGKMIVHRKRIHKPWWLKFAEQGSFLFRRPIQAHLRRKYKKDTNA